METVLQCCGIMNPRPVARHRGAELRRSRQNQDFVRVTLEYTTSLPARPLADRKAILNQLFGNLPRSVSPLDLEIDMDSISVSGQLVKATVPASELDRITAELANHKIRVEILSEEQFF